MFKQHIDGVKAMQGFQILRQTGLVLVAILMTKGFLTQIEIGNYELLLFIGYSLSFFWLDAFIKSLLSEYPKKSGKDKKVLLFNTYLILVLLSLAVLLVMVAGSYGFFGRLLNQDGLLFVRYFGLYLFFWLPAGLLPFLLLLKDQVKALLLTGILYLVLPVLTVFISTKFFDDLQSLYIGLIILGASMHLLTLIIMVPHMALNIKPALMRRLSYLAIPLMVYAIASGLAKVFDSWLISWYFSSESDFAIFRYGAREFPLAIAMTTGLSMAFIPKIASHLQDGVAALKLRNTRLMHFIFPITIMLIPLTPWVFAIVFNDTFLPSARIFNIYLLLTISQLLFPHTILLALQKNRVILWASLIEFIINVVLSLILIQNWHMEGVAFATVFAFLCEKIFFMIYLSSKLDLKTREYVNWKVYLTYCALLLMSFMLTSTLIYAK